MNRQVVGRFSAWFATVILTAAQSSVLAKTDGVSDYAATSQGQAFVEELSGRHGFEPIELTQWLRQAQRQDSILAAIRKPAEKTLEWYEYRRIFIRPSQIGNGLVFLREYRDTFERAESQFGVSKYIIAAIMGVETRYGRYTGKYRVLDALATLAFDYPPRSAFFRKELGEFFLMAREQGFDPVALKGSYAGAMGYGQFIPSSYRHYAIDFDGDGVANILTNPIDAIGSVANYFSEHGWKPGLPIAEQVDDAMVLPADSPLLTAGLKPVKTVADYRSAGLGMVEAVAADEAARAIRLEGAIGPELWLTYHNFYVITRYNHSHLYAMAVFELSRELRGRDD